MLDFIRKPLLWEAWDHGLDRRIAQPPRFHLKSIQDLAIYKYLEGTKGNAIAEIGGGNSRLLAALSRDNRCYNVDRFEGVGAGPKVEIKIPGVTNIPVFLGEFSALLEANFFDIVFSVSVVEHVPDDRLVAFLDDGMRILKPGGLWLHAIDIYIEDTPDDYQRSRLSAYRAWFDSGVLRPVGEVYAGPLAFTCDIASNPDDVLYAWGQIAPQLTKLRQRAQSVSLLLAGRKA